MMDMKMTAEEAKEYGSPCAVGDPGNAPKYPYGLNLCLNDGSLEKLGITELPKVGSTVMVQALAVVTSVGMSQQQDGDKESRVELQITDMEVTKGSAPLNEADVAKKMYPGMA